MNKLRFFSFLILIILFSKESFGQIEDSTIMSLGWVEGGIGLSKIYPEKKQNALIFYASYSHYLPAICYPNPIIPPKKIPTVSDEDS